MLGMILWLVVFYVNVMDVLGLNVYVKIMVLCYKEIIVLMVIIIGDSDDIVVEEIYLVGFKCDILNLEFVWFKGVGYKIDYVVNGLVVVVIEKFVGKLCDLVVMVVVFYVL